MLEHKTHTSHPLILPISNYQQKQTAHTYTHLQIFLLLPPPPPPPPPPWSITQTRATYCGLCGMPACGQAVKCGVCDTPELWCGAAGLCARVRACAGAAESFHTYMHKLCNHYYI